MQQVTTRVLTLTETTPGYTMADSPAGDNKPVVLVTGASGYLATHVVKQLVQLGYRVRGTVRSVKDENKVAPIRKLGSEDNPVELVEADLNDEKSWIPAVQGCEYVHHIASPFPQTVPSCEDELIKPAVNGVLSVLKACQQAGGVKRVVLTSSTAAINTNHLPRDTPWTEEDWCEVDKLDIPAEAYTKSKALAEKAAWDFIKELPDAEKFELAVINPGYIAGPPLCGTYTTSMQVPKKLLERAMPAVPQAGLTVVDVRDVAEAHVQAMTHPGAAGHRHITAPHPVWFKDIALLLKDEFAPQGYNVPTAELPNFVTKVASWFDKDLKIIIPFLGNVAKYDSSRMKDVLGVKGRDVKDTFVDMAYAMIEAGTIKKTLKYTGPKYSE